MLTGWTHPIVVVMSWSDDPIPISRDGHVHMQVGLRFDASGRSRGTLRQCTCNVTYIVIRLALSFVWRAENDMSLLRLPQELRDLIYDHLLDGVDPDQPYPANTFIHVSPRIPTDVMLVSRGMRNDIRRWWRPLSKMVIAGQGDHCVRALSSLKRTESVAMQVKAIRVSLVYDRASGISMDDMAPIHRLHHHLAVQMRQLHQICRSMLHLQTIWLQVTTPHMTAHATDTHAHIARSLGATLQVEPTSPVHDRWHQAARTDSRFVWLRNRGDKCSGRLIHLTTRAKVSWARA